ncbi:MAG: hypothetical protein OHK0029_29590 [Armatimonadaceae bacterium]
MKRTAAIVLSGIFLGFAGAVSSLPVRAQAPAGAEKPIARPDVVLTLKGLHCQGCAGSVAKALQAVKGVKRAQVDAKSQTAKLETAKPAPSDASLKEAVQKAGYSVVKIARAKTGK